MVNECHVVADIGGTNARFAHINKNSHSLSGVHVLPCADYEYIGDAILDYYQMESLDNVDSICMAVATVVSTNDINLTNNHWSFKKDELEQKLNIPVKVINDWTAQALSLPYIDKQKIIPIGSNTDIDQNKTKAFLGPGTGLGIAALLPTGEVVDSEGGHISFAPINQHEMDILTMLWKRHPRVSIERILSGMGLENLYWANAQLNGVDKELQAKEVVAGAIQEDAICRQAIDDFIGILASVAGDLALMMGAGSVFICGGILPRLQAMLDENMFRQRFEDKGRFQQMCSEISVFLVTEKYSGLLGCISQFDDNNGK